MRVERRRESGEGRVRERDGERYAIAGCYIVCTRVGHMNINKC